MRRESEGVGERRGRRSAALVGGRHAYKGRFSLLRDSIDELGGVVGFRGIGSVT